MEAQSSPAATAIAPGRRRTIGWTAIGIALGITLLYVATRKVEPAVLGETLRDASPGWSIAVLGCTVGFVALKAWRWSILLRFIPGVAFRQLHAAAYLGLAVNFLVSHAGEFLRAAAVARSNRTSISAVFASVMVERSLDFIALLLVLAGVAVADHDLPPLMQAALAVTGMISLGGIAALYALLHTPAWLARVGTVLAGPLPPTLRSWCAAQIDLARSGLSSIRDTRRMLAAVALSLWQWILIVLAVWFSALTIGESAGVGQVAATFVLLILGLMLPSSPMQIGTTQLAFTIGMGTGGMPATAAIAASVAYTLLLILPTMIIGGVCAFHFRPGRLFPAAP